MRLFIAIKLNEQTKDYIMNVSNELQCCAKRGKFAPREKLHITLLFLGHTDVYKIEKITSAIEELQESSFVLSLRNIGKFHRKRRNALYWLGVEKRPNLIRIHNQLYTALNNYSFCLQNKKFKPHITLGRNVEICDQKRFALLKQATNKKKFKFQVDSICLYSSERSNNNTIYTELYNKILK